jgi:hypothetical protein
MLCSKFKLWMHSMSPCHLRSISLEEQKQMRLKMAEHYRAFIWEPLHDGLAYNYTLKALHSWGAFLLFQLIIKWISICQPVSRAALLRLEDKNNPAPLWTFATRHNWKILLQVRSALRICCIW